MLTFLKPRMLPLFAAIMGAAGLVLRFCLYAMCLDEKFLLPATHPLMDMLWLVTAGALAGIVYGVKGLKGSGKYADYFDASYISAAGQILFGAMILLTVLLNAPGMDNYLGTAWQILGYASFPCLLAAGIARAKGKKPFFLLHMIPCLFLVMHIINHYQLWSGNPQMMDYLFDLLGIMALMFFAFYTVAFEVDSGSRRMYLGMGLSAIYLCMVSLPQNEYIYLYIGGILWALCDLCSLPEEPRCAQPREGENADDPA